MHRRHRIRTAVVGVGHFGRRHAAKLAELPQSELVAVADVEPARAGAIAALHGVAAVTDYRELAGRVDAVNIVAPTTAHYEIARFFLDAGVHVLVEKPITRTRAEADDLIARARRNGLVLQVGHQERFFAREIGLERLVRRALYIEAQRIAPFQPRGTDVSVVLDLMIHDIDLVAVLVNAPVVSVDAVGAPVLSAAPDIVNTRLTFADGCVATLVASRLADRAERRLRVFQPDGMIAVDLLGRRMTTVRRRTGDDGGATADPFDRSERAFAEGDSLAAAISAFLESVTGDGEPAVSGEEGRRALDIALRIGDSLEAHLARLPRDGDIPARPAAGQEAERS